MIRLATIRIPLCFASFLAIRKYQNISRGMIMRMCPQPTYCPEYFHLWNLCLTPSPGHSGIWRMSSKCFHTWLEMVLWMKIWVIISISEQHWHQEANWHLILLWITTSTGMRPCQSLQQKNEILIGKMEFHSNQYESWCWHPEHTRCQANFVTNLPSDVFLQNIQSGASARRGVAPICSTIKGDRTCCKRPISHPVSS